MRLASGRPSRLYAHETLSALRCPFVSLPELTVPSPSERALTRLTPMSEYSDGVASRMRRRGYALPQWRLGFVRQTHHTHRTCGATVTSFRYPPLSGPARVPFEFPRQVRPCPRGRLLSTSPFCERYLMCVETAHGVSVSKSEKCTLRNMWRTDLEVAKLTE
jgi:hypothetical protein